jgi:hypothetical protein
MNFSIFTIEHLRTAHAKYRDDFLIDASAGRLSSASALHEMALKVADEIARREEDQRDV